MAADAEPDVDDRTWWQRWGRRAATALLAAACLAGGWLAGYEQATMEHLRGGFDADFANIGRPRWVAVVATADRPRRHADETWLRLAHGRGDGPDDVAAHNIKVYADPAQARRLALRIQRLFTEGVETDAGWTFGSMGWYDELEAQHELACQRRKILEQLKRERQAAEAAGQPEPLDK